MSEESKFPNKVTLKIISQKGHCQYNHKAGQEFDVSGSPAGLCPGAYNSAHPTALTMQFGGKFPWAREDGSIHIACPDPYNPVVMEIKIKD